MGAPAVFGQHADPSNRLMRRVRSRHANVLPISKCDYVSYNPFAIFVKATGDPADLFEIIHVALIDDNEVSVMALWISPRVFELDGIQIQCRMADPVPGWDLGG